LLFINRVELGDSYRDKEIGRAVVKEIIETFGLNCGLIVCKPFPLQYAGWAKNYSAAEQAKPRFKETKSDAFDRVAKFWMGCGFVQLPGSDFYGLSPELARQPHRILRKRVPFESRAGGGD
jgi:hypothetical protein